VIVYAKFGMKAFANQLSYRAEVWLRLLGNLVAILIQTEIWRAVLGAGRMDGISLEQMITYSILNTLILTLMLDHISRKVDDSLKSGGIASELIRPLSYPFYLLADGLGRAAYQFAFTVVPSLLIAVLWFGFLPPATATHFLAFLFCLVLAVVLSFLLGYLVSLLAFWLMNHFSLSWILGGFRLVFAGSFIPLWFFPDGWRTLAEWLPFQYLGFIPAAMYLGEIAPAQIPAVLGIGVGWGAALIVLTSWLWHRAVRRLVVQGG
jgi:ABC-2 type transport system permease protein